VARHAKRRIGHYGAMPDLATPAPNADAWFTVPMLSGRLVHLEPLRLEHAPGYLAAAGTGEDAEEAFRWMALPGPRSVDEAAAQIVVALAARARGERFAYAQLDARPGEVIGSPSLYDVLPALRTLSIGHTGLGRRWWRTGHNTES
jgi:RimJ/RimL family protein N-acetyltransferase